MGSKDASGGGDVTPKEFFDHRSILLQAEGGSPEERAASFYRNLHGFFCDAPELGDVENGCEGGRVETSIGRPDLSQSTEVAVSRHEGTPGHNGASPSLFFRGQSDSAHGLSSSLYREVRYQVENAGSYKQRRLAEYAENVMREAEAAVLTEAKARCLGRGLTDLELLSVLQHQGAPTRLIDVTSEIDVALYFACEAHPDKDGRIFCVRTFNRWEDVPRPTNGEVFWSKPDDRLRNWKRAVWPVQLPFFDPRMAAQQGSFLVGGYQSTGGTTNLYRTSEEKDSGSTPSKQVPLIVREVRAISNLAIFFPGIRARDLAHLEQKWKGKDEGNWTAVGTNVRIPSELKGPLREILAKAPRGLGSLTPESLYPSFSANTPSLLQTARWFKVSDK